MESENPSKSTVSDLIKYDFLDPPSWRNREEGIPSAQEMIDQIIDFKTNWSALINEADRIEDFQKMFREKYCDINTDPLKESERQKKQIESTNIGKLLEFFDKIMEEQRRDENPLDSNCGLIEKSMVQEAHKIAVHGMKIKKGKTQPGEFSTRPRNTTYKGEEYRYPWYLDIDEMTQAVDLVLDHFNSLFFDCTRIIDEREKLKGIIKSLAWFLFEILDLHPFGNGNGRIFRSFCYYVLSSCGLTMFPCPIYHACEERENNDHSSCRKPCKDNYEQVLVDARKSKTRHPEELATMILESCWRTWVEFMKEI